MQNKNKISIEYIEALTDLKLLFGDKRHVEIANLVGRINRKEKEKPIPSVINKINELKRRVVWLIKNDF